MKVKLPIYWHTDESKMMEDLGLDTKNDEEEFENYATREIIFYQITGITKYMNGDSVTRIYANGDMFLCPLPITNVEKLIDDGNT